MDNSIPEVREREGNGKPIPKIWEREENEKKHSQNLGTGREWKKSIPTFREWESEAIIPKNTREQEREWKNDITI